MELKARGQFSTFVVAGRVYGIDVTKVQEVVKPMAMTRVPLADASVRGLINLRGQVATAVGLRELFGLGQAGAGELMNVVCRSDGTLVSLLVDEIGDVIEIEAQAYEPVPRSIPEVVRKHLAGVYKLKDSLLSVIDIDRVMALINNNF